MSFFFTKRLFVVHRLRMLYVKYTLNGVDIYNSSECRVYLEFSTECNYYVIIISIIIL